MWTQVTEIALDCNQLSPRELAVRFTDEKCYFVSEASVYPLLKSQDLITSPAYKSHTGSQTALFTLRRHTAEIHRAALCDRGENHDPGKDVEKDLT